MIKHTPETVRRWQAVQRRRRLYRAAAAWAVLIIAAGMACLIGWLLVVGFLIEFSR